LNTYGAIISRGPKRAPAKRKAAALFATVILFVLISYFFIDIPVAVFCRGLDKSVTDIFERITPLGVSTWYLVVSFSLFLLFKYYRRQVYAHQALFLFASISISGIAAAILKWIMGRFRPKVFFESDLYGLNFFTTIHEETSFPSGHSATAFSLAFALSLFFPKYRLLLYCFAIIVSASRVIITSHYLSDAVGGAFVALVTVFLLRKGFPS
jgi:membrane-associated phospholipid phosphatase